MRVLRADDKARWLELFQGYIAFYQSSVPAETIDIVWHRMISGEAGAHVGLVAEDEDGRIIGLVHILFHRSTWSPTWYCYLEDLFVDPDARGKGAGRALVAAVYDEADARGATRTYWVTQEFNATARALYDKVADRAPFVQYRR